MAGVPRARRATSRTIYNDENAPTGPKASARISAKPDPTTSKIATSNAHDASARTSKATSNVNSKSSIGPRRVLGDIGVNARPTNNSNLKNSGPVPPAIVKARPTRSRINSPHRPQHVRAPSAASKVETSTVNNNTSSSSSAHQPPISLRSTSQPVLGSLRNASSYHLRSRSEAQAVPGAPRIGTIKDENVQRQQQQQRPQSALPPAHNGPAVGLGIEGVDLREEDVAEASSNMEGLSMDEDEISASIAKHRKVQDAAVDELEQLDNEEEKENQDSENENTGEAHPDDFHVHNDDHDEFDSDRQNRESDILNGPVARKDMIDPTLSSPHHDEDLSDHYAEVDGDSFDHDEDNDDWTILDSATRKEARGVIERIKAEFEEEHDYFDTTMVVEYSDDIFKYITELEDKTMPDPHYMNFQTEINWGMRSTLIDWLLQVHARYHMLPETLWISTNIIDRFLSMRVVGRTKLQLVGVTAMFIAAKYEEIIAPSVEEFVYMTQQSYSKEDILKGEQIVLTSLEFNISQYCSPYTWVRRISKADDYDIQTRTLSKFLMEATLLDHRFLRAKPSYIAAVGMFVARKMLGGDWNESFIFYSGMTEPELRTPSAYLLEQLAEPSFENNFVYKKYASRRFLKASIFACNYAREHLEETERIYSSSQSD